MLCRVHRAPYVCARLLQPFDQKSKEIQAREAALRARETELQTVCMCGSQLAFPGRWRYWRGLMGTEDCACVWCTAASKELPAMLPHSP